MQITHITRTADVHNLYNATRIVSTDFHASLSDKTHCFKNGLEKLVTFTFVEGQVMPVWAEIAEGSALEIEEHFYCYTYATHGVAQRGAVFTTGDLKALYIETKIELDKARQAMPNSRDYAGDRYYEIREQYKREVLLPLEESLQWLMNEAKTAPKGECGIVPHVLGA